MKQFCNKTVQHASSSESGYTRIANNALNLSILPVAFFLAFFTHIAHAQNNTDVNSIQSLSVSGATEGGQVIKIGLKKALAFPPAGFSIRTPPRLVFDFPNTKNGLGKSAQDFSNGDLRNANIVQAGNRTRLVVNLNQMLSYDTQIEGNFLLIKLQGGNANAAKAASTTRFAEVKPAAQKHSLRDVDFHRGKNGEGRIQIDLSDANVAIDIRRQGKNLIVDFMKTDAPHNLQRKLDVIDFGTPVNSIDTFIDGDNVRMVIEPKGLWEHSAYQTDNKFIVELKPVADDPNKLVRGNQKGYAGEKLTLNFQNIGVREALYVIGDFINSNNIPMNLVISDSVSGNLTLRLKEVPWDQALDIILQSKNLAKRKDGNVMQIAPREELAAKEKLLLTANQVISDLEALHTESFKLSYLTGDALVSILTNKGTGTGTETGTGTDKGTGMAILSKRGSAVVDKRTNTVFIKDTPSALEDVRKMIKLIDVPVRQVMIQARFVSADDTFNQALGAKLGYTGPGTTEAGGGFNAGGMRTAVTALGNNLALPAGGGQLAISLFNSTQSKILRLELDAAETDLVSKTIASPRVVTADQTLAVIKSGTKVPYTIPGSATTPPATAFIDATLSLTVTPRITPDDRIDMKLKVTNDSVGAVPTGATVPAISNKEVNTQVLVENGGTVVIGGIFTKTDTNGITKVPLLGDIPILGWLFKNTNKTTIKSELLVFITPKILQDSLNLQ